MSEYIEREALREELRHCCIVAFDEKSGEPYVIDIPQLLRRTTVSADVAPVVHGEWVEAKLTAQLASVTAERDAAANAVAKMAEYIVTLGGVDYHLCDVIPQEHHLKYQPKNDGDYDNEPCIECVKAYFMSEAGKEQNDGK